MTSDRFDQPDNPNEVPESGTTDEFEAPSIGAAETEAAAAEVFMADIDSSLLEAKAQIESLLIRRPTPTDAVQASSVEDDASNIVGVGVGLSEPDGEGHFTGAPGSPTLEVYVIEKEPVGEMKARIAGAGVQALASADFPVRQVVTGVIDASQHRMRLRPAPGGISVGHFQITAGTLGCLTRGRHAPRTSRLMILSNNHVLANSNAGSIGDCIAQPGPFDGGHCPADQVAILERFVPIRFDGSVNFVDCATAWAWPDRVRRELMYISGGIRYFNVGSTPVAAVPGLAVGKSGRTTQLTSGKITAVGVTIRVNYGSGRVGVFGDQISIRAGQGDFSQGGDSGSLIWTWDARRAPVGLLFAGGSGTTFANRIGRVLDALDVNLYT